MAAAERLELGLDRGDRRIPPRPGSGRRARAVAGPRDGAEPGSLRVAGGGGATTRAPQPSLGADDVPLLVGRPRDAARPGVPAPMDRGRDDRRARRTPRPQRSAVRRAGAPRGRFRARVHPRQRRRARRALAADRVGHADAPPVAPGLAVGGAPRDDPRRARARSPVDAGAAGEHRRPMDAGSAKRSVATRRRVLHAADGRTAAGARRAARPVGAARMSARIGHGARPRAAGGARFPVRVRRRAAPDAGAGVGAAALGPGVGRCRGRRRRTGGERAAAALGAGR